MSIFFLVDKLQNEQLQFNSSITTINSPIGKIMVENSNSLFKQASSKYLSNPCTTQKKKVKRNLFLSEPSIKSLPCNKQNFEVYLIPI